MDNPRPAPESAYQDAVRWIYERINYERTVPGHTPAHFRLDRVRRLLSLIGSPQDRIPVVHIAGTKGKGSTAAILDAILRASGFSTGLFTSPHIDQFEERMRVNGRMPTPTELTNLVQLLQRCLQQADEELQQSPPTYFEVATLLAWMFFDRHEVELAVLETGLGGRLDTTNVCRPDLTVITNIGLDHTAILGDTIEQIAAEKAGILKAGVPLVTAVEQPSVQQLIRQRAAELQVPVSWLQEDVSISVVSQSRTQQQVRLTTARWPELQVVLPLTGRHQARNLALAVAAADRLSATRPDITATTVAAGAAATEWPGRLEITSHRPLVVVDAAHNPDAVQVLTQTLAGAEWPQCRRVLILGVSQDKDYASMLKLLRPGFDELLLTSLPENPRSCGLRELLEAAEQADGSARLRGVPTPDEALQYARAAAGEDGLVVATGSVFLAAEIRRLCRQIAD